VTTSQRDAAAGWLSAGRFAGLTSGGRAEASERLARIADEVLIGARLSTGARVVDVGAGTGLLTERALALVGSGGVVTAVDQSAGALAQIRAPDGGGVLHRVVADVTAMPLDDGVADAAVARSVLIYVDDLVAVLAEIGRVLRPGGRFSVFEPVNSRRVHDAWLPGLSDTELAAIGQALAAATASAATMTRFSETALREAADTAGFGVITVHRAAVHQTLTGREAVTAHLDRSSYPGAPPALAVVADALGADLAARYAAAWRHAADTQGTITYTTPTVFLTAVAPDRPM